MIPTGRCGIGRRLSNVGLSAFILPTLRNKLFRYVSAVTSTDEIVNLARQNGKSIRVVGAAHSPSDIHCNTEWIMTLDRLDKVLSHDLDRRRITVQAGMRLAKYLEELESRGWNMDNLGSISEQSLAGAIATGTHGSSLEHGVISTQVYFIMVS